MQEGNWIDTVVYLMLVLSTVWGIWRGLFSSLLGIVALVMSVFIARDFSPLFEPSLLPIFGQSPLLPGAAMLLVFLISFMLLGLIARLITTVLNKYDMGGINLLGGVVFGFLRGGIFAALFVLLLSLIGVPKTVAWKEAKTVPLVGTALHATMQMPFAASYRKWLYFDRQGRPIVRDVRKKTGKKAQKRRKGKNDSDAKGDAGDVISTDEFINQIQPTREREYLAVMKELSEQVAIRSANTPPEVYHGEDEDGGGFKLLLKRLTCMLGNNDCQPEE